MTRSPPYALPLMLACLLLAGCNTPGPGFRGIDPQRVSIGKSTFDVRVDPLGARAQAIRVNPEWAPRRQSVEQRAVAAIEQVSGCRVAHLDGDQVVLVARLACASARARKAPRSSPADASQPLEYDCKLAPQGEGRARMTCTPLN
ncbi:hypothetical protein BXY70_3418 [Roseovarius halotolerans]|uniref:Lipoprotein n=1 Tax=Roseovarius halotolerans TaxID=505353 RepID=A0A1X6ZQ11_9RHOB|nr:hypothetical protein [Roseovarius halotolerans]RKT28060.1 hypothetical protein BXY70_3418 [Roseovarius halotolerans]SLN57786.1 hypothetical protein ROH8110_03182 [Roseovarius halotolerans]